MRILITNDDGIRAEGIMRLARVASEFGEVKVVAPDRERSACAHAMTLREPLRVKQVPFFLAPDDNKVEGRRSKVEGSKPDSGRSSSEIRQSSIVDRQSPPELPTANCQPPTELEAYEVNGLPVDCVNTGLTVAFPNGCDLVLAGFNPGPNLGFDVTYSGTVAGAMEGTINGIYSIALSMAVFVLDAPVHYETGEQWLRENFEMLLGLPRHPLTLLNVNVPAIAYPELQGHRFVGMGQRVYQDRVERRMDPWNRPYYWQGGAVVMDVEQPGTDVNAVSEGFVAITPVSLDWTDHELISTLKGI